MAKSAVFIDLDRTLLCRASGQVLNRALMEEGVLPEGRSLPGDRLLYAVNDRLGENLFSMGLVRAAATGGPGLAPGPGAGGRPAGGRPAERVGRPLRAPASRRLPGRGPPPGAHHHDAGRHDRPLRRGLRLRRPDRHRLRDQGRPLHRPPLRGIRLGDGQAPGGARAGATTSASTWPTATPAATASSTCRSSRAWAHRTPSIPTPRSPSSPRRGAGRSSTGTARRASRASSGSSRTTCSARSCASSRSPTRASTSPASRTCRRGARSCWPRTTGATSTWPRWRWSPARSGGPCASSARRRSSTRRWSG